MAAKTKQTRLGMDEKFMARKTGISKKNGRKSTGGDKPDCQTTNMLNLTVTKVLVLLGLFVLTFIFSLLPLRVAKLVNKHHASRATRRRYKSGISLLSCFAAGVFLATCLLDLFPEVQEKIRSALDRFEVFSSYPIAEFVMSFGLFMILLVEQLVVTWKHSHQSANTGETESLLGSSDHHDHGTVRRVRQRNHQIAINGGEFSTSVWEVSAEGINPLPPVAEDEEEEEEDNNHSPLRALILLLALSLHSIFEGLAVGLQASAAQVIKIFVALLLHKCILAFSLGLNLVQSKISTKSIIEANLAFSITSPLGIGIGIAVTDFETSSPLSKLIDGCLQGLACGTFVYIVFFEILPHEFNSSRRYPHRLLKILFLILGYSTVALLLFLDPDVITTHCTAPP